MDTIKDQDKVIINDKTYTYSSYYKRLVSEDYDSIACPMCHNISFTLSYGEYELIAHCKCGHSMVVYDG